MLGGLHFRTALSKMQKDRVDYRLCTAAALEIPSAVVNGPRALREYLSAARICGASPLTPRSSFTASGTALLVRGYPELLSCASSGDSFSRRPEWTPRASHFAACARGAPLTWPQRGSSKRPFGKWESGPQCRGYSPTIASTITCCKGYPCILSPCSRFSDPDCRGAAFIGGRAGRSIHQRCRAAPSPSGE